MAKNIYEAFATDATAEAQGVVVEPFPGAGKFRIARAGGANDRYQALLIKKLQPYRRQLQVQQGIPDAETVKAMRQIQIDLFAEAVVLGWEGVFGPDGEIPYSKIACQKLLTDLPALFDELSGSATMLSTFQTAATEDDGKNS